MRRLADEGMTLIDEHKVPDAKRNFSQLRDIIETESQQFNDQTPNQSDNLITDYVTAIHTLVKQVPETDSDDQLYKELSAIYKELHRLIK